MRVKAEITTSHGTFEGYFDFETGIFSDLVEVAGRKKRKWIPHEDEDGEHYGDKCSECGEWYVMLYKKINFCPNCGADMRGEE